MAAEGKSIVIIGGGIIGCTTAYYLTRHPAFDAATHSLTLIEASKHGVAQGASGKAGGLVAMWAYPREVVNLSFREHEKLAQEHNGKDRWGWRYVNVGSWSGTGKLDTTIGSGVGAGGRYKSLEKTLGLQDPVAASKARAGSLPQDLDWVEPDLTQSYVPMAADKETAQVHPQLFTTSMCTLAAERGMRMISGKATSILRADGTVTGVVYTENDTGASRQIPATHVILAAGAWSPRLLDDVYLPIAATRAHSVTIQPDTTISPYVLFAEIRTPRGHWVSPEIHARPNNEVYACGPGDDFPLPDTVDDVVVDYDACEYVWKHVVSISRVLRNGTIDRRQACYLPTVSSGGGPIVGEASSIAKGLLIATGHTCWGISNAPGTARAMAVLIMGADGGTSRDLRDCLQMVNKLAPQRFLLETRKMWG
ncbi:FAD dependent oxidoreductase [Fistulina hepatica ATCC 64428]|uniref:FAD dependent oxidoreductase n=1 Tax=Fistulina hepatica ATCC 64428 TaxID=1128425 RepID=A0A0D7AEE7_9AGAR|nr:FAD dependent oxidoreductase [Fistulina hepatica ATCC 64428]